MTRVRCPWRSVGQMGSLTSVRQSQRRRTWLHQPLQSSVFENARNDANFGITHEGQLHFSEEKRLATNTENSVDEIKPFPYHPNTELTRYTYAWHRDLHQKADNLLGSFIAQMEEDGLMDNTIIFYYGDHGGVLPRSKGYTHHTSRCEHRCINNVKPISDSFSQ